MQQWGSFSVYFQKRETVSFVQRSGKDAQAGACLLCALGMWEVTPASRAAQVKSQLLLSSRDPVRL